MAQPTPPCVVPPHVHLEDDDGLLPSTPGELLKVIARCMVYGLIVPSMPYSDMWYRPVAALPAASARNRGKTVVLETAGADDAMYLCVREAAGTFAWKKIV